MINIRPKKTRLLVIALCFKIAFLSAACCDFNPVFRPKICLDKTGQGHEDLIECCVVDDAECDPRFSGCSAHFNCKDIPPLLGCDDGLAHQITSISPHELGQCSSQILTLNGTGLAGANKVTDYEQNFEEEPHLTLTVLNSTDAQVTLQVNADCRPCGDLDDLSDYTFAVGTDSWSTQRVPIKGSGKPCRSAIVDVNDRPQPTNPERQQAAPNKEIAVAGTSVGGIILTPAADGTVHELLARGRDATSPVIVSVTAPTTSIVNTRIPPTPIEQIKEQPVSNFLRYTLATGGAQNFGGTTRLKDFSTRLPVPTSDTRSFTDASFATAGVVEFDLAGLRNVLQQLNVPNTAIRATVRLTPIRSLNVFDVLNPTASSQIPSITKVALLNMNRIQEDLAVNYKDFPRFVSVRSTDPDDLATAVRVSSPDRVTTVRTDLLGLLKPISFDVTSTIQRDIRATNPTTGFLVASELNGAGLLFADSSTQIPGVSELIAPQLVITLDGFTPPSKAQFVSSTTRIPFDLLPQGSTDMMLVTLTNIGATAGTVSLDLTSGSNAFGLMTPDGRAITAQNNTATIGSGERLVFAVTFKPTDGDKFDGQLQVTDTTGGTRNTINRIALSGSTFPASFSQGIPSITAPIKPQRLPDDAARVGDLNGDGLIDAADIGQLAAIVAGSVSAPSPGTAAFAVADINGDGVIDRADLTILGDAVAGNRNGLPRLRPSAGELTNVVARFSHRSDQLERTKQDTPPRRSHDVAVPVRAR